MTSAHREPRCFSLSSSRHCNWHNVTSFLCGLLLVVWHWQLPALSSQEGPGTLLVLSCCGLSPDLLPFPLPILGWCHHSPSHPFYCCMVARLGEEEGFPQCSSHWRPTTSRRSLLGSPSLFETSRTLGLDHRLLSMKPREAPRTVSKGKNPSKTSVYRS